MFRVPGHGGWGGFADSWNRLELDGHMADGGRYRRRRHATFSIVAPPTPEGIHRDGVDYAFMLLVGRDVLVVTFRRKAA